MLLAVVRAVKFRKRKPLGNYTSRVILSMTNYPITGVVTGYVTYFKNVWSLWRGGAKGRSIDLRLTGRAYKSSSGPLMLKSDDNSILLTYNETRKWRRTYRPPNDFSRTRDMIGPQI